ncbi:DUF1129 family protein [Tetragenococcus halophilus]|uniref:DUF1129 family protein n=1 Tax=Tetragenococcus halophilus TaxID=51669 RepID=UPI000CC1F177|nr:DUF1129 family protein [Tetragenococcus halophilus]MCO8284828.1 DUF1129 family protein [Tetragenococcus halophilus]GBD66455.1 putative uncharacterized protein [Tetragenococcus halophilus subsp. halophilus]GBD78689.1 putative uncharacterized protein [Tetragenococcus halophilus subsp. halophilus]
MDAEELVQLNNEKRKQLSQENKKYYEDMLIYIRASYNTSDQEMEEILAELLDHLIEAQAEGKTAKDVFGKQPKQYANEILGELPKGVTKKHIQYFIMFVCYFLAAASMTSGIFNWLGPYIFGVDSWSDSYYLGTFALKALLDIPIAFLMMYLALQYIRWTCFKEINNKRFLFLSGLFGIFAVGLFVLVALIVPDIGPKVELPFYIIILFGLVLYLIGRKARKAI